MPVRTNATGWLPSLCRQREPVLCDGAGRPLWRNRAWAGTGRRTCAARHVKANGTPISFHSDMPMAPGQPLFLVWAAVNRTTASGRVAGPEHRLSSRTHSAPSPSTPRNRYGWRSNSARSRRASSPTSPSLTTTPCRGAGGDQDIGVWGTVLEGRVFPAVANVDVQKASLFGPPVAPSQPPLYALASVAPWPPAARSAAAVAAPHRSQAPAPPHRLRSLRRSGAVRPMHLVGPLRRSGQLPRRSEMGITSSPWVSPTWRNRPEEHSAFRQCHPHQRRGIPILLAAFFGLLPGPRPKSRARIAIAVLLH